jgi:hypothetical protein
MCVCLRVQLTFSSSVGAVHGTGTFAAVDIIMPSVLIVLPDSPCCVGVAAGEALGDRAVWDGDNYFHLRGAAYFLNEHRGPGEFNVEWWPASRGHDVESARLYLLFVRPIPVGQELLLRAYDAPAPVMELASVPGAVVSVGPPLVPSVVLGGSAGGDPASDPAAAALVELGRAPAVPGLGLMPKVPFLRRVVRQTRAVRSAGLVIFRGDVLLSMDRLRRSAVADAEDVGEDGRGGWLCSQGSGMAAGRSASDAFMGQLEDLEFPRLPFFVGRMSRSSPPSDSVAAQRVIDLGVGNAANVATWAGLGVPSPRIGSHCVPTSGVTVFFRWEMRDVSVVDVRVIRYPGVREVGVVHRDRPHRWLFGSAQVLGLAGDESRWARREVSAADVFAATPSSAVGRDLSEDAGDVRPTATSLLASQQVSLSALVEACAWAAVPRIRLSLRPGTFEIVPASASVGVGFRHDARSWHRSHEWDGRAAELPYNVYLFLVVRGTDCWVF